MQCSAPALDCARAWTCLPLLRCWNAPIASPTAEAEMTPIRTAAEVLRFIAAWSRGIGRRRSGQAWHQRRCALYR
ncbi:hypothetical protein HaLaN_11568 [Haematococcus lacustris]|uniref:Uncharacterized protein n=1 Tax=Haematococcus lacustris TaxID=44745 RepID=A0A699Z8B7_HAELA|nr:hypothetical protein HaLaN_11568 [Haematococcus lacustris]